MVAVCLENVTASTGPVNVHWYTTSKGREFFSGTPDVTKMIKMSECGVSPIVRTKSGKTMSRYAGIRVEGFR